jgi:MoxR-like ATPase
MATNLPKPPTRKPGSTPLEHRLPSTPRPAATAQPKPAAPKPAAIANPDLVARIKAAEAWVRSQAIGRDEVVRAMTLGVLARANVLLLGPPGTGKTMVAQKWASTFADQPGDVFDVLLSKFSRPAEVFGPIDIAALERGETRTKTAGFLPSAKVGILDEVFKGSSAILNALLRIANERQFADNGQMHATPTRTLVGMSNEYPEDPALLAAFFDRFPIKLTVRPLDDADFSRMLGTVSSPAPAACPVKFTDTDLAEMDRLVAAVDVSRIIEPLGQIRRTLATKGVQISDRRWVQAIRIIRAYAVLAGRTAAISKDLAPLAMIAWNTDQDVGTIREVLPAYLSPFAHGVRGLLEEVREERAALLKAANVGPARDPGKSVDLIAAASAALKSHSAMNSAAAKLDIFASDAEDADDRVLLADTRTAIDELTGIIAKVAQGRDGGLALEDLAAMNIG